MNKKIINILLLITYFTINSQSIKNQILDNVFEIKSVSPDDINYSDLEVIGNAIGNAKIVFLGEQDHGDATTFEAKTRIIKYLHEKKGFSVVAFESDFFNINKKSDNEEYVDEIEKSIFPIWSNCAQVNPLFNYIKSLQKKAITISGFDCQIAQNHDDDDDRIDYIDTILKYIEKNITVSEISDYQLFRQTLNDLIFFVKSTKHKKAHFKKVDIAVQKKYFKTLSEILNSIQDKDTFLYRSLENAYFYAKMAWKYKEGAQGRDEQMGKNILWLHKVKFPNEKIIVWAHTAHLIRTKKNKVNSSTESYITAGEYVCSKLSKSEVYSIGFTSRIGETQRASLNIRQNKYKVKKPKKNSFENWLFEKKIKFGFINFKDLKNSGEKFHMKGLSHYSFKKNWLNAFDGMLYIDEMFPCIKEKE